tara:strand:- start:1233 stop:1610 length:378 start_codon:yes stop_codon:yes gene_type:complete
MSKFELPANLEELYKAKTGSVHSPSTLKLYKSYLNKIAKAGYTTPALLIKEKKKVLEFVKSLNETYQKTAMTSIFYALSGHANNKRNKGLYKDYYNKLGESNPRYQEYLAKKKEESAQEELAEEE